MIKACNKISAIKSKFLIATIFITGFLFCVNTSHAQAVEPYWSITLKHTKYKIENNADTICLKPKQLKQTFSVEYNGVGKQETSKTIIVVMTAARQELGRYALNDGKAIIPLNALSSNVTDKIVSLNIVQQPLDGLLAKKARIGTKLLCYIKW